MMRIKNRTDDVKEKHRKRVTMSGKIIAISTIFNDQSLNDKKPLPRFILSRSQAATFLLTDSQRKSLIARYC